MVISVAANSYCMIERCTVEPHYNEVLGTMKISTLLYQVSHYIRVRKQRNIKSWGQQGYLVTRGFHCISDLFMTRFHCRTMTHIRSSENKDEEIEQEE